MSKRSLFVAVVAGMLSWGSAAFAQTGAQDAGAASDGGEGGPPDVSAMPFSQDSIRQVMTYHQPRIQACYEQFLLEKERALGGRLLTAFTITAEGLVKKARVVRKQSTLKDSKLYDCVVSVLVTMTFPKPPGGKEQPVEYPFNLKAIK